MEDIDNGTTDNTNNGTNNGTTGNETTPKSLPTGDSPNKSLDVGEDSNKSLEEGEDPHKTLPTRDHETKKINESEHETKANDEAYEEPKEEVKADLFNLDYFDKPEEAPPEVTEKASELINGDLNYFDNWITEAEDQKKQNKEQLEEYLKSNVESGNQLAYNSEDFTEAAARINSIPVNSNPLYEAIFSERESFDTAKNTINGILNNITNEINRGGRVSDRALNTLDALIENMNMRSSSDRGGISSPYEEASRKIKRELEFAKQKAEDINTFGVTKNTGISSESERQQINDALGPAKNRLQRAYESGDSTEIENAKRNYEQVANRVKQEFEGSEVSQRAWNVLNKPEVFYQKMEESYGPTPTEETTPTRTSEPARTEETPATSTSATSSTTDDLRSAHEETTLAAMDLAEALGTSPSNIEDSDTARALQSGEFGNITSADEMRRALIEDAGFPLDESTNAWARWAAARNRERITRESGTPRGTERGETPTADVTPTEETSTTESETPETETESSETSEEEGTTDVEPETETPTTSSDEDVIAKADEAKAAYEEAKKREYEAIHREADETEIAQLAAEVERLRQEWEEAEAEAAALRPREDGEDSTKEPRVGHGKEDRELSKEETLPEWIGGDDPHTSSAGAYWAGAFGDENWSDKVPQKTAQGLIDYANDHHDNPFAMFGMTALMEAGGYDALKAGRDVQDMIASAKEVTVNANNALEFFKNGSVLDGIKSILSTGWSVLKVLGNTLSAAWNVCKSAFSFLRSVFAPISSAVSSFLNTVKGYNSVKAMIRDMYGIENTDEVIKEVFGDESEKNAEQKPVNALNKTGFSVKGGTITDESGYNKGMKEKENDIASDVCKKTMLYFPYLRKSFR